MNLPNMNSAIPILGRPINEDAIREVKKVLAALEKGTLINVALVAERNDGEMIMAMAPGVGHPVKLRGILGTLGTAIDLQILGK